MRGRLQAALVATLCLAARPVMAEPAFPFDPDRLFADHAALVEHLPDGSERLQMPGGVEVTRRDGDISAIDGSGKGAVGCMLLLLAELEAALRLCDPHPGPELSEMQKRLAQVITFSAKNAYPPISENDLRALLSRQLAARPAGFCAAFTPENDLDLERIKADFLRDMTPSSLNAALETPRLPVINPCL